MSVDDSHYLVRLENLMRFEDYEIKGAISSYARYYGDFEELLHDLRRWKGGERDDHPLYLANQQQPGLIEAIDIIKQNKPVGAKMDLHGENMMMRDDDGTIVITDPYA